MRSKLAVSALSLLLAAGASSQSPTPPAPSLPSTSFEKWMSLRQPGAVALSPDGVYSAYTVSSTDWKENSYDAEIWIARKGMAPWQLTRTGKNSSYSPQWSPDSKWIAFLTDRGDKSQIYIISINGGEAFPLTKEEEGINGFSWSPDGQQIAFKKNDPESKTLKSTKDRYGAFGIEGTEYRQSHLWTVRFNYDSLQMMGLLPCYTHTDSIQRLTSPDCLSLPKPRRLTEGDFTITNFEWSPDGSRIAYTRQPDPLINSSMHADIAVLDLATNKSNTIIANPAGDQFSAWSPEGDRILYSSSVNDSVADFYANNRIFVYELATGRSTELATGFDEDKYPFDWNKKGIFFSASQKTRNGIFHLDPASGKVEPLPLPFDIIGGASFTPDGNTLAFAGRNYSELTEI